jgi:hypothetical protein
LLAAARRIATRLARIRAEGTPSLADFRHALRDVARCCIHGVDRNPMAVELTKVALWIETVDPGLPLGFFDAQVRCGDALLGIYNLKVLEDGIPDAAYRPLTGDDKDVAKYYLQANRDAKKGQGGFDFGAGKPAMPQIKPLALDFSGFRDLPEDTVEQIGAKAGRFEELRKGEGFLRARAAADLYVAAFLSPKFGDAPAGPTARTVPTTEDLWMVLGRGKVRPAMAEVPEVARHARALHWPLEFPDVMSRGGFDVVVGNPPWERIKLQEQEFFAARNPEIANAPNKTARDKLIKALANAPIGSPDRDLFDAFSAAKREAEATSEFVRLGGGEGGRFALTGRGDVNTYALFAELFANLAQVRAGVIVPTGVATDATTAPFFAELVEKKRLAQLVDFENRAGLFPAVDSRMKFCLLTLGRCEGAARFAFFLTAPAQLAESERNFVLTSEIIASINPSTRSAPIFRSGFDANLGAKLHSHWKPIVDQFQGLDFYRCIDVNKDAAFITRFQTISDPEYVPLYEGKMISAYDHRAAGYSSRGEDRGYRVLPEATTEEHGNPKFEQVFFSQVKRGEVEKRLPENWSKNYLVAYKDVGASTNERSMIAAIIPRWGSDYSVRLAFPPGGPASDAVFIACLNSIVFDYLLRQKMNGLHISDYIVRQMPVPNIQNFLQSAEAWIALRVLELTYTSHAMAPFARALHYNGLPFAWDESRRACLRADLDAFYARAYGLDRVELRYVLDPADVKGPDYPSETFRVLKEKEIREFGEYRTRRLVLEAWDRMEAEGEFKTMGMG